MSDTAPARSGLGRLVPQDKNGKRLLLFASAAFVCAIGYLVFFSGGSVHTETSATRGAPQVVGNPTSNAPTAPSMVRSLQTADNQRADTASRANPATGASAMPTPIVVGKMDRLPSSLSDPDEQAPTNPVPRPLPPVTPPPVVVSQAPRPQTTAVYGNTPVPQQPQAPVVDQGLMQAMLRQMHDLDPKTPSGSATTYFYNGAVAAAGSQGGQPGMVQQASVGSQPATVRTGSQTGQLASQASSSGGVQSRFITPAAGTILYSRLVGRVNSDTPGPVVGEILQGPFAGARLLGTFQFSEQGVVINFSSMTVPYKDDDGNDQSEVVTIHAVAVDASHLGTAMATDIDRHLLERIGVAFGTAFLQGLGQAVAQSGSTATYGVGGTTVSNATLNTREQLLVGGGAAAGAAGQVFSQIYGNRRTTITVEADTPFGLLFLNNN